MFFQNSLFWSYEWNASFLGICDTAAVFSVCFSEQQSKEQHEGNGNAGTIDPLHWPSHHRCPDSPHPLDSSDDTTFKDLTNRNWWTRDAWSPFTARRRRGSLCKKQGREIILPKQIMGFSISPEIKDMTYWLQETPDPDYWSQYTIGT